MGDLAIGLLLESLGLVPKEIARTPADVYVTVFDSERQKDAMTLAAELRQAGLKVICNTEASKLPKQFKFADRIGVKVVAVIGPDEAATNQVTIKDLVNATQQTVSRTGVTSEISKLLESHRPL
jgi:histidyl-tRNA synthetase